MRFREVEVSWNPKDKLPKELDCPVCGATTKYPNYECACGAKIVLVESP